MKEDWFSSFEEFLDYKETVTFLVDDADRMIKMYCRNFEDGVVPPEERISLPFRGYRNDFNMAFKELQRVNRYGHKFFKKELDNYRKLKNK